MRLLAAIFLLLQGPLRAADFQVPAFRAYVTDQAGMLQPGTRQAIELALSRLWQQGGSQIAVLTVPNLGGLEIEQASIKVTDAWKLGDKKKDNGVLLMIAKNEHRIRIEVGYGLEGELTDLYCGRVVVDEMVPLMREGRVDDAVLAGVLKILEKSDPNYAAPFAEPTPPRSYEAHANVSPSTFLFIIFIILFIMLRMIAGIFGFGRRRGGGGFFIGGGGFGGGGFGGGGFGGGGGGGFGGGGASGGW